MFDTDPAKEHVDSLVRSTLTTTALFAQAGAMVAGMQPLPGLAPEHAEPILEAIGQMREEIAYLLLATDDRIKTIRDNIAS